MVAVCAFNKFAYVPVVVHPVTKRIRIRLPKRKMEVFFINGIGNREFLDMPEQGFIADKVTILFRFKATRRFDFSRHDVLLFFVVVI